MEFAPDLCSRVTFVNFTVTRSSLQSQCLNQVLKAERPDVDAKRSDLLKLQGDHFTYIMCIIFLPNKLTYEVYLSRVLDSLICGRSNFLLHIR